MPAYLPMKTRWELREVIDGGTTRHRRETSYVLANLNGKGDLNRL
jgi:hypothetical protein